MGIVALVAAAVAVVAYARDEDPNSVVGLDELPAPGCSAIEDFDERLYRMGIPADVSPSSSPGELLGPTSFVIRGRLTGGSSVTRDADGRPTAYFEVEVDERVLVGSEVPVVHERQLVGTDIGLEDVDAFADAALASAGVPVIVVAERFPANAPTFFALHEGFATACDGGPLLGRVGFQGEWAEIDTLDELADALRG